MVHTCTLCNKNFPSKSQLDRHKNKKTPCNAKKESTDCVLCDAKFPCMAKLEKHKQSNKHKNNYNIYIQVNNIDNSTNIQVNVINAFENTNISKIDNDFIELTYVSNYKLGEMFQDFIDEGEVSVNNMCFILCFNYFIKIFSKLNFNIAFKDNHNCKCISFTLSNDNMIEYQILSYDSILKDYTWEVIDYYIFIEKFLNLMNNINDKFQNENFKKVLDYIERYKHKYIKKTNHNNISEGCKKDIEKELLIEYNKFKKVKEDVLDEETQIAQWRENNRIERERDAKRLTMMRRAIESKIENLKLIHGDKIGDISPYKDN